MAQPKTFNGSKILIKIGDGADPETFATKCTINASRSVQGTATTVDTVVPDCDDPDAPAWTEREKDALSYTLTGDGVHDAGDIEFFATFLEEAGSRNCQVFIADGVQGAYMLSGKFHLTDWQASGARKEKTQGSMTFVSDGVITRQAAAG